jgi:hypothetical protein
VRQKYQPYENNADAVKRIFLTPESTHSEGIFTIGATKNLTIKKLEKTIMTVYRSKAEIQIMNKVNRAHADQQSYVPSVKK